VTKLRICGAILLLPLYTSMEWTGTIEPLPATVWRDDVVWKEVICLTHNVIDLLALLAHSHCTHTFAQTQPQRVFRVVVALRV